MNQPVTIYTTPTCGYCRATKDLLRKHTISFTEIDVSHDIAQARQMIEKSGQMGVPVTVVGQGSNQTVIVGFDQPRLAATFGFAA